jgi:hypothetical protein
VRASPRYPGDVVIGAVTGAIIARGTSRLAVLITRPSRSASCLGRWTQHAGEATAVGGSDAEQAPTRLGQVVDQAVVDAAGSRVADPQQTQEAAGDGACPT